MIRALWNTCAFYGSIAVLSFFWNCGLDLRHWYMTLLGIVAFAGSWKGFHFFSSWRIRWEKGMKTRETAPFTVSSAIRP
jgi:hypothetical protein